MACFTDEAWNWIPDMLSRRLSLKEEHDDREPIAKTESAQFPFENVFPVYAMGLSNLGCDSVLSFTNSAFDPIWDAVREEAKLQAEKEPILSSFLYASILSHDCLEQALGFVLVNRLQNPTLLATQLKDIFCDVIMHHKDIQYSIRIDLLGYHSLKSYRVAHALWKHGHKLLAFALQSRISEVFGIDMHPAARIGDGILLDHGTGVVIGETAVTGNQVSLMHGVTLGGTGKETGNHHPKVGDGALIGACVTVLGNIKIGEGAMIAAGTLVLKEVPLHSTAAGTPAKVLGYKAEQDPS